MFFGYNSLLDFFNSLLKGFEYNIIFKFFLPIILTIDVFFGFIFQNTEAIYFLIALYIIDFITGVSKSIYYTSKLMTFKKLGLEVTKDLEDKKLVSKKFPRFLFTMLAAVTLLSLLSLAGKYSIVFSPVYSVFYSVFLGQQLISIAENLSEMNLLSDSILKKLKRKVNEYLK